MPFMAGCQNWWLPGKKCESQFFCASHFNVLCDKFINVNISEWSSHLLGHWRHDREPILQLSRKWSSMPCINLQNSGISLGERCIIIWWKRVCGCLCKNLLRFYCKLMYAWFSSIKLKTKSSSEYVYVTNSYYPNKVLFYREGSRDV